MISILANVLPGHTIRYTVGTGLLLSAVIALCPLPAFAQNKKCPFETTDSQALARCLLRPVKKKGILGGNLPALPAPLDKLIGQPVEFGSEVVQQLLQARNIREADVGGALSVRLPKSVRFFVIHDTSSPYLGNDDFPPNIDDESWPGNNLNSQKAVAHVFVNRAGESVTKVNFDVNCRATKFEKNNLNQRGLFVHIEMIQPRRRDPAGPPKNDFLAPDPGFSQAQLDRLALLYVVASVRRGEWLIPAFHCAVDAGIPNAHDDPQNFDVEMWLSSLKTLLMR